VTAPETEDPPYSWAEDNNGPFAYGACVALVRGSTPSEVLDLIVEQRATPVTSAAQAREWAASVPHDGPKGYGTAIEAGAIEGWTLVYEENGYAATDPAVLCALSRNGEAVVIYTNVNAVSSFQYARGGTIVREFDPLLEPNEGAAGRLPEEHDIVFPGENGELHPMVQSLRLAERLTGVRLKASDLRDANDRVGVGHYPG
jgi:hypothetical protein